VSQEEPFVPQLDEYFWNSVDLLSVFSPGGRRGVTNPAWEKVLGWDTRSLQNIKFMDLVHPEDVERTEQEARHEWNDAEPTRFGFENRLRCLDGSYRWIEWTSRRRGDLVYATGRDVTNRHDELSQLDETIEINQAIFAAATDAILVIDRDMIIADSSPSGQQVFGFGDRDHLGNYALSIVHPNDRESVHIAFQRIFDFNEVVTTRFRARHADGHWITFEARGQAMGRTKGPATLAVVICRDVTRSVAEEEAHADSLRKITAIIDTAVDVITMIDREMNVIDVSPSAHLASGVPLELRRGRSVLNRVHPDDQSLIVEALQRIFERGETATVRFRFQNMDGQWLTVESRGRALVDAGGPPTTAVITTRDVTESVAAEMALAQSVETTNAILDASVDGIVMIDRDLIILESSSASERVHGVPPSERRGHHVLELMHPDDKPLAAEAFRKAFDEDGTVSFRSRMRHLDGRLVTVEMRGRTLQDAEGHPTRLVFIARDVSEAVAAEAALARSLEKTTAILAAAADSIVVIDRDLVVRESSPGTERIFGYSRTDRIGQQVLNIMHLEDQPLVSDALKKLFEGDSDEVTTYRFRARHADGHEIAIETRGRLLRDAVGQEPQAVLVSRDITEAEARDKALEEAKSDAERANRAKSEFMSRMSHELRTPLNSVLGFAQILQMESRSTTDVEAGDQIYRSGQHLLNLINEVLEISRIESGTIAVSLESVLLDELVVECVNLVRPQARDMGVTIMSRKNRTHRVVADRNRLRQVLINLLSNAIKYNRPGGTVTLTREVRAGRLRLLVSDTGRGIAPELVGRLFIPFDRLGAESLGIEGTGLGLALSQSLAEAMGGTLSLESTSSEGTTFLLDLSTADR
jgi:PAS domain S-box-containing protein